MTPLNARVAEAHHLLGAIEWLHLPVGADARDEQVDGVGADVEGGDLHSVASFSSILSPVQAWWQRAKKPVRSRTAPTRTAWSRSAARWIPISCRWPIGRRRFSLVVRADDPGGRPIRARSSICRHGRRIARSSQAARHGGWRFSVDKAFERVMRACAAPAPGRESTWIGEDFIEAYVSSARGFAHSIEVWEAIGAGRRALRRDARRLLRRRVDVQPAQRRVQGGGHAFDRAAARQ